MKTLTLLFTIIISFNLVVAAQSLHFFDLLPFSEFKHFKRLPFDSVVVIDDRIDDRVCVWGNGTVPIMVYKLDSVTKSIKGLIVEACKHAKTKHQTLFIKIKEMRFADFSPLLLYFYADAYVATNNGFHKIATLKKGIVSEGRSNEAYFKREIKKGLAQLLKQIVKGRLNDTSTYSFAYLSENIIDEWKRLPILTTDTFPSSAIYKSSDALRQNMAKQTGFEMEMESDSSYVIVKQHGKYSSFTPNQIYATSYKGQLYIRVMAGYFLPATKVNGLLYFRVPESMPGMNMIYGIRPIVEDDNDVSGTDLASELASAFSSVYDYIALNHRMKSYEKAKETAKTNGAIIEMRDCYIDMDTGDIIYY